MVSSLVVYNNTADSSQMMICKENLERQDIHPRAYIQLTILLLDNPEHETVSLVHQIHLLLLSIEQVFVE